MAQITITGEKAFSVPTRSFAVSPSNEGYTLNYSADGVSYTAYTTATPANEVLIVNGVPKGMIYKLVGNQSELTVTF